MFNFTLPTGRSAQKDKQFCVAVKCNGRWSTRYYKTFKGADNEYKNLRASSRSTICYYGIEDFKVIKGVPV